MTSEETEALRSIETFLRQTIGLEARSLGANAIALAVRQRCEQSGIADAHAYWAHLCLCAAERQELIETLVVPETWFFRDRAALAALANWAGSHPALRILSLPCSSGEEPYSIAMALLDAGLTPDRFVVEGVDISERAIAHARRAVYGKNSFRGADLTFRERHFHPAGSGFCVSESVRAAVQLRQANLFAEGAFAPEAAYDAIFCRNVLIYFDEASRQRALRLLHRLLKPTGILFVGPAEAPLLTDSPFTPARIALAFAFYRTDSVPATSAAKPTKRRPAPTPTHEAKSIAPMRSALAGSPGPVQRRSGTRHVAPVLTAPVTPLEQARQLADEGQFDEALRCCQQHLRAQPESVEAHYLAGLVCDASGHSTEAREYYRRTLYLDPAHYEALIHLAETLRSAGDTQGAQQLLERARRAQSRGRTA